MQIIAWSGLTTSVFRSALTCLRSFSVRAALLLLMLTNLSTDLSADDWSHWRGANRDDKSTETGLLQEWPADGPELSWRIETAGLGYAGFSVVADRIYTLGQEDDEQFALCLNAGDGTEIWRRTISQGYNNNWGDGPRSTPSIDGEHGFFFSSNGNLVCLKLSEGEEVWSVKMSDFGGETPFWGYSESPLVDGEKVVCTPGGPKGTVLALNKMTGEKIWQSPAVTKPSEDDKQTPPAKAHYSSISPMEFDGQRVYVQLTVLAVIGVSADKGALLWQSDWPGRTAVIPSPVIDGDLVYVTSGYGIGSKLIQVNGTAEPKVKWQNKVMKNHHGGVIQVGDHYYGHSDPSGLTCQNQESGERVWTEKRFKKGAITWAENRFYYVQEKDGKVLLLELDETKPTPASIKGQFVLEPQTRRRKPKGKIWVHPVISNGRMFLRDQELIYCYDVSKKN